MRKEFRALPAQHLPRFLSLDAIVLAVPQQAFDRDLFRPLRQLPLAVD